MTQKMENECMEISTNKNNYYHFLRTTYTHIYTHTLAHTKVPPSLKLARQEGPGPPTNTQTTHSRAAAGNTQHTHTHASTHIHVYSHSAGTYLLPFLPSREFNRQKLTWLCGSIPSMNESPVSHCPCFSRSL